MVTDAPAGREGTQSIESTGTSTRGQHSTGSTLQHDESGWIHIRAVITSAEAATVIGKGGENVSLIRKMSGAKCTVSDYQKGAVERILTVSGVVDAAAKVCTKSTHVHFRAKSITRPLVLSFAHSIMNHLRLLPMPSQRHTLSASSSLIS